MKRLFVLFALLAAFAAPQWTPSLVPAAWSAFTDVVTSTNGVFWFLDDGSQSGGLTGPRYYRLQQLP